MNVLPPAIAAYVRAINDSDLAAANRCFSTDARVYDECCDDPSQQEVNAWLTKNEQLYHANLEVIHAESIAAETTLIVLVAGTFRGSPLYLHLHFELTDQGIQTLRILP